MKLLLLVLAAGLAALAGVTLRAKKKRLPRRRRQKLLQWVTFFPAFDQADQWSELEAAPSEHPRAKAWLAQTARKLKIKFDGRTASGNFKGYEVRLFARPGDGYRGLAIRVEANLHQQVQIESRQEEPDPQQAVREGIDDLGFDLRIRATGPADALLAMLDAKARELLLELDELGMVRVQKGDLDLLTTGDLVRAGRIAKAVHRMVKLARRLKFDDKQARLLRNVQSRDLAAVRMHCLEQLGGDAAVDPMDPDPAFRLALAIRNGDVAAVRAVFDLRKAASVVRARAAHYLAEGEEMDAVEAALAPNSPRRLRLAMVRQLRTHPLDEAVPLLVEALRSADADLTATAAAAMVSAYEEVDVERLLVELFRADGWSVRAAAVRVFADIASPKRAGDLEPLLEDPHPKVRAAAVAGRKRLGQREAAHAGLSLVSRELEEGGKLSLAEQSAGGLSVARA